MITAIGDDHHNVGKFAAMPLGPDQGKGDSSRSLLSIQSSLPHDNRYPHARQEFNNTSGFIFGVRFGFVSQLILGLLAIITYVDKVLSELTECLTGMVIVTALWGMIAVYSVLLSSKIFFWMSLSQGPQLENAVEQEYNVFHGSMIGVFFAWLLFDLLLEASVFVLCGHVGITLLGHCYLQRSEKRILRYRRAISSDDSRTGLDIA
jgi:tetrahydromethanopterin S-methyltransferase subunit B